MQALLDHLLAEASREIVALTLMVTRCHLQRLLGDDLDGVVIERHGLEADGQLQAGVLLSKA